MATLHAAFPDDVDGRAFYALSLLGLADGVRIVSMYFAIVYAFPLVAALLLVPLLAGGIGVGMLYHALSIAAMSVVFLPRLRGTLP